MKDQRTRFSLEELTQAYYWPIDPEDPAQRIQFGTSGHRGSSLKNRFNEAHLLAVTQATADYRREHHITGPLFLGFDTHALSENAFETVLEVLAANDVAVMIDEEELPTPTPVISHAILTHRHQSLCDGIVLTPSHNPPEDGGFKYNPPTGGPAGTEVTNWIEQRANAYLKRQNHGVKRIGYRRALDRVTLFPFVSHYASDLKQVIDFSVLQDSSLKIGVDPLGGAGLPFWEPIADRYRLNLTVVNSTLDPLFSFMPLDHDGQVRMDCSSSAAMANLLSLKDQFDLAFGNDPDVDRHGIVTAGGGLLNPNHYLAVAIDYLLCHRPEWSVDAQIGKTLVSSALIDRVVAHHGRSLYEVPVGFKWFVDGLLNGHLVFGGEESAGASFLRLNGDPWSTDKDGIIMGLLAAEMMARTGKDPGERVQELFSQHGQPHYRRLDAAVGDEEKKRLLRLTPEQWNRTTLAGDPILQCMTKAPGNAAAIGGLKVSTEHGWFAARPSGTEAIYKIYGESLKSEDHLDALLSEAQERVQKILSDS